MPRRLAGAAVVAAALIVGCSQKQADVTSAATTAAPTTASPATTAAPGTTRPAGGDFCDQAAAHVDILRDLSGDRAEAVVVFRDLAAVAPDGDIGAGLSKAADLLEENADASQADLEAAVAQARDDDPDFARNISRVPAYVQDQCGISISSSTQTTVRRSTTTTVRGSTSTTAFDPLATTDSRDLFEGGLRSYLAQNYGDQPWYADIDRFSLVISEDSVGQPIVQAAVGSTTTDFDEATAKDICLAVVRYAGSSELDRDVSVTGVDDRILVRTKSYRYQCTPP
ncbi:MAG: hypothetical protein U0Q07_15990 [Acidimicrobiales bacterium]